LFSNRSTLLFIGILLTGLNTVFLILRILGFQFLPPGSMPSPSGSTPSPSTTVVTLIWLGNYSVVLAPISWLLLAGGFWYWRGSTRALWKEAGFSSDVFKLLMKMKGGPNRVKVLNALQVPKDRLQLSKELGLDWKVIDSHIKVLHDHGLIQEHANYGRNVRLYVLTDTGKTLLKVVEKIGDSSDQQH
jgi:predicted transcriptional regulator